MFIASFSVSAWQSNCYVVGRDQGGDCVIIDPGPGSAPLLDDVVAEHGLKVCGVLATHGHIDHIGDAARVCASYGVPLWIHPADRFMLTDPEGGIAAGSGPMLRQMLGRDLNLAEPAEVRDLPDADIVEVAGLAFRTQVAPGHSAGCTLLSLDYPDRDDVAQVCLCGDVIFAGSIGRTDLATGDPAAMDRTLLDVVATMDPTTVLLPGHGSQTTIGRELAHNPYLQR